MPNGNSITYYNNLYKTAQSKNFGENTKYVRLQDVLPNQFNFEHGKLNCVIHYDNVSQQEQEQMKLDIKNAYEAYKAKFCIANNIKLLCIPIFLIMEMIIGAMALWFLGFHGVNLRSILLVG
ncbi:MAG: hypothetical protein ACR5K5_02700 [Wolbachia sp.]